MYKTLVYGGIEYPNFEIDENGNFKNRKTGKQLKTHIDKNGYRALTIPMGKRGKVKLIKIHKALAETFIPNQNGFPCVDHIDEDKTNYSLSNLRWTTVKCNTRKHWAVEAKKNPYCNNRKLTTDDVDFIRKNKDKMSQRCMARMFGVSHVTICNVVNGLMYVDGTW